jgi:hypothetical protein
MVMKATLLTCRTADSEREMQHIQETAMWNRSKKKDKSQRRTNDRLDESRIRGALGKPDVYPAEEFTGVPDSGEFPEWRPTDQDGEPAPQGIKKDRD